MYLTRKAFGFIRALSGHMGKGLTFRQTISITTHFMYFLHFPPILFLMKKKIRSILRKEEKKKGRKIGNGDLSSE